MDDYRPLFAERPLIPEMSVVHSREVAKQIFAAAIHLVEVELFSFCNRRCGFCTNALSPRDLDNKMMADDVFQKIVSNLQEIDYSHTLTFTRYNENLAFPEIFLDRLSYARSALPKARIAINTNGDYLNTPYLYALRSAGLDYLSIQVYLADDEWGNLAKKKQIALKKLSKLRLPFELIKESAYGFTYQIDFPGMQTTMEGWDFQLMATDRGGQLNVIRPVRSSPCLQPMQKVYVDFNGSVMPCCDLRSDVHGPDVVFGVVSPSNDLFDILCSATAVEFRRSLLNFNPKTGPCRTCTRDVIPKNADSVVVVEQLLR